MYNHNKAQQSKNRVHISWDILYIMFSAGNIDTAELMYSYLVSSNQEKFTHI